MAKPGVTDLHLIGRISCSIGTLGMISHLGSGAGFMFSCTRCMFFPGVPMRASPGFLLDRSRIRGELSWAHGLVCFSGFFSLQDLERAFLVVSAWECIAGVE